MDGSEAERQRLKAQQASGSARQAQQENELRSRVLQEKKSGEVNSWLNEVEKIDSWFKKNLW
jgi:hypothetical protein